MNNMMLPIIIGSALLPIIMVVLVLGALMKKQGATDQLLKTGLPARGRILQLASGGGQVAVMGHRHLTLTLTVEVQPQAGQPYVASFQQLISELQLPSVQPGAQVELRIDPQNPARMALASVIPPGQAQQGQWPGQQPQQGFGHAPGGFAPAPIVVGVAQPNYKSSLLLIIIMLVVTTVPVTAILLYTFVDFGSLFGTSSSEDESEEDDDGSKKKKSKGSVCEQAVKCCKVIGGAGAAACENYRMMPVEGCRQTLDAQKQAAKAQGKSCD